MRSLNIGSYLKSEESKRFFESLLDRARVLSDDPKEAVSLGVLLAALIESVSVLKEENKREFGNLRVNSDYGDYRR